jgi:hypothetical protein
MQKNIVTLSIALIMALHSFAVYALNEDEESDANVPPGMVMKRMGGRNMIIPKDSWVTEQGGGLLVVEDPNQYAARKFMEIEKHFAKIDADLEAIHKEMQESKNSGQKQ